MVLQLFQTQCPLPLCSSEASILILAAELYDSLPAILLFVPVAFSTWACSPQPTTSPTHKDRSNQSPLKPTSATLPEENLAEFISHPSLLMPPPTTAFAMIMEIAVWAKYVHSPCPSDSAIPEARDPICFISAAPLSRHST